MPSSARKTADPAACPLCGEANHCQLCTIALYKGPCWCARVAIPDELIAKVPIELKDKGCICANCVADFHLEKQAAGIAAPEIGPGDFYFENGLMVFNAAFHLRRGYCCRSGCRHCPYA